MFEVGKKYKHAVDTKDIFEVLFVGKDLTFVRYVDGEETIKHVYFNQYIEHKEPRKFVRYVNVYDSTECVVHYTVNSANEAASINRLACVRVELTEGQFDD